MCDFRCCWVCPLIAVLESLVWRSAFFVQIVAVWLCVGFWLSSVPELSQVCIWDGVLLRVRIS